MNSGGDTQILFALTAGLGALGVTALFFRDYAASRLAQNQPVLPPRVSRASSMLFWIALYAGTAYCFSQGKLGYAMALTGLAVLGTQSGYRFKDSIRQQQAILFMELAQSVEQNLPLAKYFSALAREPQGNAGRAVQTVARKLGEGCPLSAALDETALASESACVAVKAAEKAGGAPLGPVLRRLANEMSEEAQLASSLAFWFDYPFMVLFFWSGITLFQGMKIFSAIDRSLKAVNASSWGYAHLPWIYMAAISIFLCCALFLLVVRVSDESQRISAFPFVRRWQSRVLRLGARMPVWRTCRAHRALAQTSRTLGALLSAGTPVHSASALVAAPALAGPFSAAFQRLAADSAQGQPWPLALQRSGLPDSFVALANAGAAGRDLPSALTAAAEWHEAKARRLEHWITAALPCIVISACGVLAGSVYIGEMLAIQQIQNSLTPFNLAP